MRILLANPRGFCAGVDRAIEIVDQALTMLNTPVYVRHEVVHNRHVVDTLQRKGAIFVEELDEVPDGALVIFSAHGVARHVYDEAKKRSLTILDATCPLVTKVHIEVKKFYREQKEVILIGHANHPEVIGTMGQYDTDERQIYLVESVTDAENIQVKDAKRLAVVTQTTLSVDDTSEILSVLKRRFPNITNPRKKDICYATQNRQDSVKKLTKECDLILIVGAPNSSNSNRLREIAERQQIPAYLIEDAEAVSAEWLAGKQCVGISAGASAPEVLVQALIAKLKTYGADTVEEQEKVLEPVTFSLPRLLRDLKEKSNLSSRSAQ